MAKSNSFFGLRRGSTKTFTFQIIDGKQVTKDRVTDVKNPRTNAQMRQRLAFSLVSRVKPALSSIVDHSFENVTFGQSSLNEFMRLNVPLAMSGEDATDVASPFNYPLWKEEVNTAVGEYVIARGSLRMPEELRDATDMFAVAPVAGQSFSQVETRNLVIDVSDYNFTATTTWQQAISALFPDADYLSFVSLMWSKSITASSGDVIAPVVPTSYEDFLSAGPLRLGYRRFTLSDASYNTPLGSSSTTMSLAVSTPGTIGITINLSWSIDAQTITVTPTVTGQVFRNRLVSVCLVASSSDGKRSDAQLDVISNYPALRPANTAFETWPVDSRYVLNGNAEI